MPQNFVRLYLDEDVSVLVGRMVRARGYDVLSTLDAGNLGSSDLQQLEYSARKGRVLLTHNRVDFEKLAVQYFEQNLNHPGIIVSVRRIPRDIVLRLLPILGSTDSSEMMNQIRYI